MLERQRRLISLLLILSFAILLTSCGDREPLSDEEIDRIAERVDERLYPKISGRIQQEFLRLQSELAKKEASAKLKSPSPMDGFKASKASKGEQEQEAKTEQDSESDPTVLSIEGGRDLRLSQFEDIFEHKTKIVEEPRWRNLNRKQLFDSIVNVELLALHGAEQGMQSKADFQHWAGTQISNQVINLLFRDAENSLPPLNEERLKQYYEETKALYKTREYMTVYTIEQKSKEEAEEVLEKIEEGADFQKLAKKKSIHPSSRLSGRMDRIYPGILQPKLYEKLKKAELNELLGPWQTERNTYALYKVTAKHPSATNPFELVRGRVRKWARDKRREKIFKELEKKAEAAIDADFNPQLLEQGSKGKDVLAKVGEILIDRKRFNEAFSQLPEQQKKQFSSPEGKRRFLHSLYRRALFYSYAQQDSDFTKRHANYLEYLNREKLAQYYVQQEIKPKIQVGQKELKSYYDKVKKRFKAPHPYMRARQCYFGAIEKTEDAYESALKRAEAFIEAVKNGASFAALAKEKSQHGPSKKKGGETGWFSRNLGPFGERFFEAAVALEENEITLIPVKNEDSHPGYFVIQLLEKNEYQPFAFVRQALKNEYSSLKAREALQEVIKEIRKKRRVETKEELLSKAREGAEFKTKLTEENLPPKTKEGKRTMVLKGRPGPDGRIVLERDLKEEKKLKEGKRPKRQP